MQIDSLLSDSMIISLIKQLSHSCILVTGATGMIGSQLIRLFSYANKKYDADIQIIGHARNGKKVERMFNNLPSSELVSFVYGDMSTDKLTCDIAVDYIVHAAAPTASKDFINKPVEVISAILHGMENVLEFAEHQPVKKVVYLSTMEIYGVSLKNQKRNEQDYDILDHLNIRSSYPESKKMAETICSAWFHEENVPVCIARLTQTFGYGVSYNDQRVFAEFARCAVEKRDILLHSTGETRRNYLFNWVST
jgi:dTDP-glucose 4,6-dehydratase